MNSDKKENIAARQRYVEVRRRNMKLSRINIGILGIGLLLKVLGYENIGINFIWLGIIIFVYTIGSNVIAKMEMNKTK